MTFKGVSRQFTRRKKGCVFQVDCCKYLTKYSCKDPKKYCPQSTTASFFHEACKHNRSYKTHGRSFLKIRASQGLLWRKASDLGNYWNYMTWEVIARRRRASFKELMVYWKEVLDKSLNLYCLPLEVFSRTGSQNIKHHIFCWKLACRFISQTQRIIFIRLLYNFLLESLH